MLSAPLALSEEDPTVLLLDSNAGPGRLDVGLVDRVHDHWVLERESLEGALLAFEEAGRDESRPALERAKSHLTRSHLHWQHGDREGALLAVDEGLVLEETVDGLLLKARLLDAGGDESGAVEWYRRVLESTDRPEEREFVRIRLAMIEVDGRNVEALVGLAGGRDQGFRNRAAITLAVLGHPGRALELYRPDEGSERYFRQLVRVAEWALKAGDHGTARDHAWRAYDATDLRFDALYALTLVDESYRSAGELDALVSELESRGVENEDLLHLRIDLLIDLERYDDAIELYRGMAWDESDVEARLRLIGIYDTAGKTSEMVAEYERLIESEPWVVQWYAGLATHYINVAEPDRALEVWERFESRNRDRVEVLVLGGERMNQMGYEPEALAMLGRHAAAHGPSVYGNVFLFETHYARGRETEAERALEELREWLPSDSSDLRAVADGFERLRRHERALEVYEAIKAHEGGLGYDDRTRLAWLHSVVGNKEVALDLWQEIWVEEDAPARRSFAESQFLLIAAELNVLADLAVDLETKLYAGTADRNEMNLLVRIYTEVGDAFSAEEIVKEFARNTEMPPVDRLRQLGLVYLQLQEYSKYDEVLRELERIDPENRIEHIQNIVLNLLAFDLAQGTSERYADIQHWLEELRRYDAEAVSGEFEASVLSMGGFSEEAIESYRRALIEQPAHSDNLLLLADLMKEDDRTMEAVALLQYVAEHAAAEDDNEFVVAVDGIINMVGQRQFFEQLPPEVEAVFRWTHRVILERITAREGKFYLYTLLSEIAQETNDREGEFAAMENSVSQAGIRRLAVLREIVTMATPNAGFFSMYQNEGDPERQLTYGRRLIGLRQQLPPEVYISVAKTLLDQGDTIGAEKSLSLVRDITGQIDVTKTKGDLFLAAGYGKRALAAYSQALAVNRESLELQFKTAALREGNGQLEVANALYASALTKVMQGLPAALQAAPPDQGSSPQFVTMIVSSSSRVNTDVTRDYRTYYDILMQGLIATWPESEERAAQRLDGFVAMFEDELAKVVELMAEEATETSEQDRGEEAVQQPAQLSRFARLNHLAKLMRRLCSATGHTTASNRADRALAQHFAKDETFTEELRRHYENVGVNPDSALSELMEDIKPEAMPDGMTRIELELDRAIEQKQVEKIVRLTGITELSQPLERMLRGYISEGNYQTALRFASVVLDENDYRRLLNTAAPLLQEDPGDLIGLIFDDPEIALEIEEKVDTRLATIDKTFLRDSDVQALLQRNLFNISNLWHYVKQQDDVAELISLFEHFVDTFRNNQLSMSLDLFQLHGDMLRIPLDEALQQRVEEITKNLMGKVDWQDEFLSTYAQGMVFNFNVDPTNVDAFFRIVANYQSEASEPDETVALLRDFYDGNKLKAFAALVERYDRDPIFAFYSGDPIFTVLKDQYEDFIDQIRRGSIDDIEAAKKVLTLTPYFGVDDDIAIDDAERLELLEELMERVPADTDLVLQASGAAIATNKLDRLESLVGSYYEIDNSDEFIRMAHYLTLLNNERYGEALAVALDGGPDLRDQNIRDEIFERNDAEPILEDFSNASSILKAVRDGGLDIGEFRASVVFTSGLLPEGLEAMIERLQEVVASDNLDPDDVPLLLRSLWRGAQATSIDDARGSFYGRRNFTPLLLQWPSKGKPDPNLLYSSIGVILAGAATTLDESTSSEVDAEPTLIELLMAKAPLGKELEQILLALTPSERRMSSGRLYELVTKAYREFPDHFALRWNELNAKIEDATANDHELSLWMRMTLHAEGELTESVIDAFVVRARQMHAPTTEQLVNFAKLLSKLGFFEQAVECFELLVIRRAEYNEFSGRYGYVTTTGPSNDASPMSVLDLVETANEHLPKEYMQTMVQKVVPLMRPFSDVAELHHIWKAFALRTFAVAYEPREVIASVRELSSRIDEPVEFVDGFDGIRLVHLARIHNLNGDFARAHDNIRLLFTEESMSTSRELTKPKGASSVFRNTSDYVPISMQNVAGILGLRLPGVGVSLSTFSASDAVPDSAGLFIALIEEVVNFDNRDSVDALVGAMRQWLDDSDIDKPSVLEAMARISRIDMKRANANQAREVAESMQEWLLRQPTEDIATGLLGVFVPLVLETQIALDLSVANRMFELGRLDGAKTLELLKLLQQQNERTNLIGLARLADSESAGLNLLREIRSIVADGGDADYVASLDERILVLENAYESIKVAGGIEESVDSS